MIGKFLHFKRQQYLILDRISFHAHFIILLNGVLNSCQDNGKWDTINQKQVVILFLSTWLWLLCITSRGHQVLLPQREFQWDRFSFTKRKKKQNKNALYSVPYCFGRVNLSSGPGDSPWIRYSETGVFLFFFYYQPWNIQPFNSYYNL